MNSILYASFSRPYKIRIFIIINTIIYLKIVKSFAALVWGQSLRTAFMFALCISSACQCPYERSHATQFIIIIVLIFVYWKLTDATHTWSISPVSSRSRTLLLVLSWKLPRPVISLPSYVLFTGSGSLNASNTSSSHLPTKFSQLPNLHTFITSSTFNVLAVLAYSCSATFIILSKINWSLLPLCFTLSLESASFFSCKPHSGPISSISYSPIPSPITSSSSDSPLCTSITPSLFHSPLKTYLFYKSYPP